MGADAADDTTRKRRSGPQSAYISPQPRPPPPLTFSMDRRGAEGARRHAGSSRGRGGRGRSGGHGSSSQWPAESAEYALSPCTSSPVHWPNNSATSSRLTGNSGCIRTLPTWKRPTWRFTARTVRLLLACMWSRAQPSRNVRNPAGDAPPGKALELFQSNLAKFTRYNKLVQLTAIRYGNVFSNTSIISRCVHEKKGGGGTLLFSLLTPGCSFPALNLTGMKSSLPRPVLAKRSRSTSTTRWLATRSWTCTTPSSRCRAARRLGVERMYLDFWICAWLINCALPLPPAR